MSIFLGVCDSMRNLGSFMALMTWGNQFIFIYEEQGAQQQGHGQPAVPPTWTPRQHGGQHFCGTDSNIAFLGFTQQIPTKTADVPLVTIEVIEHCMGI